MARAAAGVAKLVPVVVAAVARPLVAAATGAVRLDRRSK